MHHLELPNTNSLPSPSLLLCGPYVILILGISLLIPHLLDLSISVYLACATRRSGGYVGCGIPPMYGEVEE